MKRALVGVVVLLVAAASVPAAEPADILKVVPESSLAAFLVRNPDAAAANFYKVAVPMGAEDPGDGPAFDALLREMGLLSPEGGEGATALPASVDRKGPMAVVIVVPELDIPGDPVALVVRVTDYAAFLKDVAKDEGVDAAEATPDGNDVVRGKGKPCYVARLGDFAAVSDAEYVVRSLKRDAQKNLASGKVAGIRRAFDSSDVAVYANPALAVRSFKPLIAEGLKAAREEMQADPDVAIGFRPEEIVEAVMSLFDTVFRLGEETDAVVAGVDFSEKGLSGSIAVQPVPDTTLAHLAAAVKPAPADWLGLFDGPFVMAGSWNVDPALSAELAKLYDGLVDRIEVPRGEKNRLKQAMKGLGGRLAALSGSGGVLVGADAAKKTLRVTVVSHVERQAVYVALAEGVDPMKRASAMLDALGLRVAVDADKAPEVYRDVRISCGKIRFGVGEGREEDELAKRNAALVKAIYGDEIRVLAAGVRDVSIVDMCGRDSAAVRAIIDHALDDKKGSLAASPAFAEATASFPAERAATFVLSVEGLFEKLTPLVAYMGVPAKTFEGLKFDKPSAVGVAVVPAEKGLALHFNVPMQEMLNIAEVVAAMDEEDAGAADPAPDKDAGK